MGAWRLWMLCGSSLLASGVGSESSIRGCEDGSVDAVEDSDPLFTCGEYWIQGPQWTVYDNEGQELFSGSCCSGTCTPSSKKFQLDEVKHEKRNKYTSRLTITNITRDSARKLVCSPYSCNIKIIVPPLYKADSCNVYISNWMVNGRCTLTRMFYSDNKYTCGWTQNNNKEEFGSLQIIPENYTERNSKSNVDGVCSFTKTMPVDNGNYTYSMKVLLKSRVFFEETLYIVKPYPANLNHSCPNHVFEGSNVNCTCFALTTGSPSAQIEWDGKYNETLLLNSVGREMNKERFTCRMIWGPNGFINETTFLNLNVAYGPSGISIKSSTETWFEKPQTVLKCTAIDVYPSAEFHWNILCDNETYTVDTSTCMLLRARVQHEMTVACTASNQIFKNVSLSGFFVLNVAKNTGKEEIIGGVVAAAAPFIAVIVVLIVVYHIKRRNINKTEAPAVRFSSTSGDQSTISIIATSGNANNDKHVTPRETIEKNSCAAERRDDHQTRRTNQQVDQTELKANNRLQPQPLSTATSFMNFTEAETNSSLCVYHTATRTALFGTEVSDTRTTNTSVLSEDEYHVLRFQEAQTGQEDHVATYSHLNLN